MTIKDEISGEMFYINNRYKAIELAKYRVKHHNSEFAYKHRGHHYSQNAIYEIKENTIIIRRQENGN